MRGWRNYKYRGVVGLLVTEFNADHQLTSIQCQKKFNNKKKKGGEEGEGVAAVVDDSTQISLTSQLSAMELLAQGVV